MAAPIPPNGFPGELQEQNVLQPDTDHTGYDCEFTMQPTDAFQTKCPVCLCILRDPYESECCGTNLCHVCLKRVQANNNPCPTCNRVGFSVHPNKGLRRSLIQLSVHCTHQKDGCGWTGELGQLDGHLNINHRYEGCSFVVFECMHGCGQSFERHELNKHEIDCHERQYLCQYCKEYKSTFRYVTSNHWEKDCPRYPMSCPNECEPHLTIERQSLEDHLNRDCPLVHIECDFCFAGCKAKLQRKDMPVHLDENTNKHLSLVAAHSSKVSKRVEEDGEQISELEEKLTRAIIALVVVIAVLIALVVFMFSSENYFAVQQEVADLGASGSGNYCCLQQEIDLSSANYSLQQEVADLQSKQQQMWELLYSAPVPQTVTMTDFEKHKRDKAPWFSDPFYTHPHGFKMCLNVDASTNGGAHVSVYVYLMRGEFDDSLKWPFRGDVTIQLLNQLEDKEHHSMIISYNDKTPDTSAGRVTTGEKSKGWGYHKFISSEKLKYYNHSNNCQYLKDDYLQFQVTKQSQFNLHPQMSKMQGRKQTSFNRHLREINRKQEQMETSFSDHLQEISTKQEQIWKLVHTPVLPVTFTMNAFSQHKRDDDNWFSDPFYTHPNGYKMCLNVDANGYGYGEATHISVFIHLMQGEFDNSLSWPFQGGITIQLLNQLEDQGHHSRSISSKYTSNGRVTTEGRGQGWGTHTFISHNELKDSKYIKHDRLQFRVTEHNPVLPCIISMDIFEHRKNEDKEWFSEPFYTHPHGYKMCLNVDANGYGHGKGTHVSVFVYLMRGEFDDHLEWPFRGDVMIQLLNQLEDKQHRTVTLSFSDETDDSIAGKVTTEERGVGLGSPMFISHNNLKDSNGTKYLENDCLLFRVTKHNNFLLQQEVSKLSKLVHTPVLPVTFTMNAFSQHKRDDDNWFSDPFYTHPNGYKMCLNVDANGYGSGEATHISVFIHLMQGEFDNSLKWPFQGGITVQLLNQLEDQGHHSRSISSDDSNGRVTTEGRGQGWGIPTFISHNELKDSKYIKHDRLQFRVTEHNPVLPCIITMDIFEHRKNEDKVWFSDPFYTHPRGYKMRFSVTANGSNDGTHVSVYVSLMRGEFDDLLEWPFRGDFAITLLNQLEDKQHHTKMIFYSDEIPDTAAGRVTTGDIFAKGWGIPTFISHNDLIDSKYLKNDCLQFRVAKQNHFLLNQEVYKLSKLLHTSVIPFIITMDNFAHHKNEDKDWFSDPFYTHPHGYKMRLCVIAGGRGDDKGKHITVFIHLMRGEFDDHLKWPFRGDITIQLLNQLEDKQHRTLTIPFNDETPDSVAGRVTTGEVQVVGIGGSFISHNDLGYKKKWLSNVQYLRNDSLKFKITKVEL